MLEYWHFYRRGGGGGEKKDKGGAGELTCLGLAQLVKDTAETPSCDSYSSILSTSSQLSSSVFNFFLLKMFLEVLLTNDFEMSKNILV